LTSPRPEIGVTTIMWEYGRFQVKQTFQQCWHMLTGHCSDHSRTGADRRDRVADARDPSCRSKERPGCREIKEVAFDWLGALLPMPALHVDLASSHRTSCLGLLPLSSLTCVVATAFAPPHGNTSSARVRCSSVSWSAATQPLLAKVGSFPRGRCDRRSYGLRWRGTPRRQPLSSAKVWKKSRS
jgi:hypothetical protein